MDNPLLGSQVLPPFPQIRPEHVEPAMRELLGAGRRKLEEIAAAGAPTFDSVVEPLEALQHRLSKTWSPVSHLNAVANNEPLRNAYNACLPLLSEYQTDLAQSEALYRAYLVIAANATARASPPSSAACSTRAARLPPRRRRAATRPASSASRK